MVQKRFWDLFIIIPVPTEINMDFQGAVTQRSLELDQYSSWLSGDSRTYDFSIMRPTLYHSAPLRPINDVDKVRVRCFFWNFVYLQ
jgi:hypothetical protein